MASAKAKSSSVHRGRPVPTRELPLHLEPGRKGLSVELRNESKVGPLVHHIGGTREEGTGNICVALSVRSPHPSEGPTQSKRTSHHRECPASPRSTCDAEFAKDQPWSTTLCTLEIGEGAPRPRRDEQMATYIPDKVRLSLKGLGSSPVSVTLAEVALPGQAQAAG